MQKIIEELYHKYHERFGLVMWMRDGDTLYVMYPQDKEYIFRLYYSRMTKGYSIYTNKNKKRIIVNHNEITQYISEMIEDDMSDYYSIKLSGIGV